MTSFIVIPARLHSTRLPEKLLLAETGKPLIQHTYESAQRATRPKGIIVAADHQSIAEAVQQFGGTVVMTDPEAPSGTDRVAEVALQLSDADIIVNVQGDEPLFNPKDLSKLIKEARKYPRDVITGYCEISDKKQFYDLNVPKVILSKDSFIIYASRAPVPSNKKNKFIKAWRQICAYSFPKEKLKIFYQVKKKTQIEKIEDIEYLRFLELGIKLRGLKMSKKSIAVDTKEDVAAVNRRLK